MVRAIDLNSDLGESFGAYTIGFDAELFPLISSANVACGFHGGDPRVMERTIATAREHGVAIGAHPGFLDLVGFGRREIMATPDEVRTDTLYQLGALDAFCRAAGVALQHVKAHGALYNRAVKDPPLAGAIAAAVAAFDKGLIFLAQPGTALFAAAERISLPTAREGFADPRLQPRRHPCLPPRAGRRHHRSRGRRRPRPSASSPRGNWQPPTEPSWS